MTEEGEADLLCAPPRAAASASRRQLSAHNLGHYYKVFLGIDTDPKDQPPMKNVDPVADFHRKILLNKNYEEKLWEIGLGPMPSHLRKSEKPVEPLKQKDTKASDDTLFYTVCLLMLFFLLLLYLMESPGDSATFRFGGI